MKLYEAATEALSGRRKEDKDRTRWWT